MTADETVTIEIQVPYERALELPGAADGVEVLARVALAGASHAIEEEADG